MTRERIPVGRRTDLPVGALRYVEIDGLPIALANAAGNIYAFSDSCRHEGGPLSAGVLIGTSVTCPWHGWAYDIRSGKSLVPPVGLRIATYPVEIDGDDLYLIIDWPDDGAD
jgi:3-phenylpropionate/trans-cinnamate dioxygenase ferredoxin component